MKKLVSRKQTAVLSAANYSGLIGGIGDLLGAARRGSARAVNAFMTATYWEIGRRIVEFEQGGKKRAGYGEELLQRLAEDLTARFGRGFSLRSLRDMRSFYLAFGPPEIRQTLSAQSDGAAIRQTPSAESTLSVFSLGELVPVTPPTLSPTNRSYANLA